MKTCTLNHSEFAGVTGSQFEEEFVNIGRVQVTWNGEYQKYNQSMNEICQRQEPNSALKPEGQKLRNEVAQQMSVNPDEIQVFASVGTCLDKKHGVDLFIMFRGQVVTIDLTLNPQKEFYKANVIVSPRDVQNGYVLAASRIVWAFKNLSRPSLRA